MDMRETARTTGDRGCVLPPLCPTTIERHMRVRVYICDECGALTVVTGGATPLGWQVGNGVMLCSVCQKEAA